MAKGCPNQKVIDDFIVYMNCAAIGIFVLSAITLLGAYGPYTWISPDDIQGAGGRSGLVFVVPLTGALVISGIQITSNRFGESMPTAAEMIMFSLLHVVSFLACYLAAGVFQLVVDSAAVLLTATALVIFLPGVLFIHFRRKHHCTDP